MKDKNILTFSLFRNIILKTVIILIILIINKILIKSDRGNRPDDVQQPPFLGTVPLPAEASILKDKS